MAPLKNMKFSSTSMTAEYPQSHAKQAQHRPLTTGRLAVAFLTSYPRVNRIPRQALHPAGT
jgi:hypothetical protein